MEEEKKSLSYKQQAALAVKIAETIKKEASGSGERMFAITAAASLLFDCPMKLVTSNS